MPTSNLKTYLNLFFAATGLPTLGLDHHFEPVFINTGLANLKFTNFSDLAPTSPAQAKINSIFIGYEIYFLIPFKQQNMHYLLIGPILCRRVQNKAELATLTLSQHVKDSAPLTNIIDHLPLLTENTMPIIQLFYFNLTGTKLTDGYLRSSLHQSEITWGQKQSTITYINREQNDLSTLLYQYEQKILHTIKQGNHIQARTLALELFEYYQPDNPLLALNQAKLIITTQITSIATASIQAGVNIDQAYTLRDLYIKRCTGSQLATQLKTLYLACIVDFCVIVKRANNLQYPIWIRNCIDYTLKNLHETLSLVTIAAALGMSPTYISHEFKQVTGEALSSFINRKKIEEAAFLLKNTTMSLLNIATLLNFNSQSYFSKLFKAQTTYSPANYRKQYRTF